MADLVQDQPTEANANSASVNLVELFQTGDNGIERRRTENLFKQLDERQLTEDEQTIIQKRVELQRKMFQEYERRERQRKMRELQEVCPDLDEAAAQRALELCNWREEEAAERVSSDATFFRRVRAGHGAAAPLDNAPAPKTERNRNSRAAVGPRPRLVDPSQVGAVFVGRFKSRLGPHQISAMGRQQPAAAAPGAATTVPARADGAATTGRRANNVAGAAGSSLATAPSGRMQRGRSPTVAAAQEHHQQGEDEDMADVGDVGGSMEPDTADGEEGADGDGGCGGSEAPEGDEDEETIDPNSADLSDNELQYEEDVLPVMSPLASKKQRQVLQEETETTNAGADNVQPGVPGQSPIFRYRLVAETSNGNVHSVATEDWRAVLEGRKLDMEPHERAPGSVDPTVAGVQPAPVPAADDVVGAAPAQAAMDEDEVSSPPSGQQSSPEQQLQGQQVQQRGGGDGGVFPAPIRHSPTAFARTPPNAGRRQAGHRADGGKLGATPPVNGTVAGAAAAAVGRGVAAHRPRRATAEIAAAAARIAALSGDGDGGGGETGSDGDSDFEFSGRKGTAGARGRGAHAQRSGSAGRGAEDMDTDDEHVGGLDEEEESDDDDSVDLEEEVNSEEECARGSRKRKAGSAPGRRQPRKRAASGVAVPAFARTATRQQQRASQPLLPVQAHAEGNGAAAVGPGPSSHDGNPGVQAPQAGEAAGVSGASGAAGSGGEGPTGRPQSGGADGDRDSEATVTEDESPGVRTKRQAKTKKGKGGGGRSGRGGGSAAGGGGAAISASGHTCRGRVKQKGVKRADLLAVGNLVARPGWYNAGYIFPAGFRAQTLFRSSVDLDSLCLHTCEVLGEGGTHWPAPTFVVTAADRPDEPLVAKSCTGCWTAVLRRINGEIEGRRAAGQDLPPPPKTAIAGPEYFGLNQPEICAAIEALDPERKCSTYWDGKMDREAARGGQPLTARAPRAPAGGSSGGAAAAAGGSAGVAPLPPRPTRARSGGGGGGKGRRGGRRGSGDEEEEAARANGEEDAEETYAGNRWSAVTRSERYRKRCEDAGEDGAALLEAAQRDNPLPGFLDPITLEPVVNPAISPYGHVMGFATWKAVLAEQGRCPFTKQSLKPEALTVLTKTNIDRYRSRIIQQ